MAERRGVALAMLFVVGVLNVLDRQIINVLAQDIKTDLGISDTQLGLLTGTAFGIFYSLLGIPLGRLADRVNRVKLIALSLAAWSGFTALSGMASSFAQLFIARVGVGVGEAGSQPASTSLVADLVPEERRNSALSLLMMSVPVGSFIGLLLGGYLASLWGWRSAFVVAGAPGLLFAVALWLTVREPRAAPSSRPGELLPFLATFRELLRRPGFGWLLVGLISSSFFVYAAGAWLPAYFIRTHHMSTAQIASWSAFAVGIGGAAGMMAVGILCDALRTRIDRVELNVLRALLLVQVPLLLLTLLADSRAVCLAAMTAFYMCVFAYLGPVVKMLQHGASPAARALAVAIGVSISNVLNLGLALPLVGALSDTLRAEHGVQALRNALTWSAIVMGVVGVLAYTRVLGLTRSHARTSGSPP